MNKIKTLCAVLILALLLNFCTAAVFAAEETAVDGAQPGSETDVPITPGTLVDPAQLLYDPNFDLFLVEPDVLESWYATELSVPDASLRRALIAACGVTDDKLTVYNMINGLPETLDLSKLEIADLTGLEYAIGVKKLYLADNKLTDISPLKNLYNLAYLDVSGNQIGFLPGWLFSMHSLSILNASKNGASSITAVTTAESVLTELYLENNEFSSLPDLSCCKNLTALSLSGNNLTHFPSSIAALDKLTIISAADNDIDTAPDLSGFTALTIIDLSKNQLTSFPSGLASLTKLAKLSLSHNKITEIPAEALALPALETLEIAFNEMTSLPAELAQIATLKALDINMNRINLVDNAAVLDELIVKLSAATFAYKLQSVNFTLKLTYDGAKPTLSWSGVASASTAEGHINIDRIVVERRPYELSSTTQLLTFEQIAVLDSTASSYTDETAERDTPYSYRVTVFASGLYGTDTEINDSNAKEIDTTQASTGESDNNGSTVKIIVGIVILLVLLGVLGLFFYIRKRQNSVR